MSADDASVHIISVLHNSARTLDAFIEGVRDQGDHVAALTLVDNGSSDDTVARSRSALRSLGALSTRLIEQGNLGFAGGYAAAVQPVDDGLVILCVNPDVRLAPGAVADMLGLLRDRPSAGIVTTPLVDQDGLIDTASRRRLPRLGGSILYSVLGSRTPPRWRYNSVVDVPMVQTEHVRAGVVEATTGALMLVARGFRTITTPVFDTDYWMYGEDLQLCADARDGGFEVLIVEREPSLHLKGASSGRPRSLRSNAAFHRAMWLYARKNLISTRLGSAAMGAAVLARFVLDEVRAQPAKARRRRSKDVVASSRSGVFA